MKTFQKLALVSAIAAAPFAAQAMEALDDSVLGNTTGQAGVTIELSVGDAGITVGEIKYTDTKTAADNDGGSVVLQDLAIKNITKLTQTIDVASTGDLVLGMTGDSALVRKSVDTDGSLIDYVLTADETASTTDDVSGDADLVALGLDDASSLSAADVIKVNTHRLSAGNGVQGISIALGGSADNSAVLLSGVNGSGETGVAELINNLSLSVDLGDSTTTIYNLANSANNTLGDAGVLNAAGTASTVEGTMAIGMEASFRINSLDVGIFGYTETQANAKVATGLSDAANDAGGTTTSADFLDADGNLTTAAAAMNVSATKTAGQRATEVANGSAVDITGLSFVGLDGGLVKADQVIWADEKGVNMQIGSIAGNLNIHSIAIGGASIGSVSVSNINLAGMTQTIYGH